MEDDHRHRGARRGWHCTRVAADPDDAAAASGSARQHHYTLLSRWSEDESTFELYALRGRNAWHARGMGKPADARHDDATWRDTAHRALTREPDAAGEAPEAELRPAKSGDGALDLSWRWDVQGYTLKAKPDRSLAIASDPGAAIDFALSVLLNSHAEMLDLHRTAVSQTRTLRSACDAAHDRLRAHAAGERDRHLGLLEKATALLNAKKRRVAELEQALAVATGSGGTKRPAPASGVGAARVKRGHPSVKRE